MDMRYWCFLMLVWHHVLCETRVLQYEATSLTDDIISVDVHSDVIGAISWRNTDDHYFKILVKVTTNAPDDPTTTDVLFLANNDSVRLLVQHKSTLSAHAPMTGTGNRLTSTMVLIMTSLAGAMSLKTTYMLPWVLVNALAQGETSFDRPIDRTTVDIEVLAPSRFTYGDVSLYIFNGEVGFHQGSYSKMTSLRCQTSTISEGCPQCCHGNGACIRNQCICQDGFNQDTFCETQTRQDIFYSHPLDPRLENVNLPSGTSITLSRSYNTPEAEVWPYLLYPESHALDIRHSETGILTHRVHFFSNGLINEIHTYNSNNVNTIFFKRNRVDKCKMKILLTSSDDEQNFKFDACDVSADVMQSLPRSELDSSLQRHTSPKQNNGEQNFNLHTVTSPVGTQDIPVSVQRCGHHTDDRPRILIKLTLHGDTPLTPSENDGNKRELNGSSSDLYKSHNGFVVVLGAKDSKGAPVIRLPDIKYPLENSVIQTKCVETVAKRRSICRESHLRDYEKICDFLSNQEMTRQNASATLNGTMLQYSNPCYFVVQQLNTFCDRKSSDELHRENSCLLRYSSTTNLFEKRDFKFIPYAVFSDGKTVKGSYQTIRRSSREIFRNGISIIDTKPDFKIDKLSVIPNHPVPHDIYQVRLEYSCATNTTLIKMTVTGSDKYSNHVTCHGGSISGTCTLHAAGAPDAVVDNVQIKVSDSHTGFEIIKEMVIII